MVWWSQRTGCGRVKNPWHAALELITEKIDKRTPLHLATLHANSEADARELLSQAQQQLGGVEHILSEVSPVVGNHAGPGTVGLTFLTGV